MSAIEEFEAARGDLEQLLVEVLGAVLAGPAVTAVLTMPPPRLDAVVSAHLAIHDEVDGSSTVVELCLGKAMAGLLAGTMFRVPDPDPDDVLDAVAELGNIVGGNVKSLFRHSCRLSLPQARFRVAPTPAAAQTVRVHAEALGHVVELSVRAADAADGLLWPGAPPSPPSRGVAGVPGPRAPDPPCADQPCAHQFVQRDAHPAETSR